MQNPNHLPKHSVPVRVTLINDSHIFGVVYVRQGQRILDMLCDDRKFFPVRANSGVSLLNKSSVMQVDVMTIDEIELKGQLFPEVDKKYLENNAW